MIHAHRCSSVSRIAGDNAENRPHKVAGLASRFGNILVRHARDLLDLAPRSYDALLSLQLIWEMHATVMPQTVVAKLMLYANIEAQHRKNFPSTIVLRPSRT